MRISDWSSDVCSSDLLLFLGSWRSTVIIVASIPLAILGAIIGLAATGQTLNVMTLSGLALAIGILVDDATVTIENINWHLENGKPVLRSILDGAAQIDRKSVGEGKRVSVRGEPG